MVEKSSIAQAIVDFRKEKMQSSQTNFAAALGVTLSAVAKWETGRATPSAMALMAIGRLDFENSEWWFKQAGPNHSRVRDASNAYKKSEDGRLRGLGQHRFVAVPLISAEAGAGPGRLEDREDVEGQMSVPRDLCHAPKDTACIRIVGSSMEPTIMAGSIVAVDQSQTDPSRLARQIVCASHDEEGLVVKRLASGKGVHYLVSDQLGHLPIRLDDGWRICGKVIWWIQIAEGR